MAYKIVGATGCPTGIAHTYMAKEVLEKAAAEAGVSIKIEAHGQSGVENTLTPEEINDAEFVLIAADKDVNAGRFAGKKVLMTSVGNGLRNPEKVIAEVLAGKGAVYAPRSAVSPLDLASGAGGGAAGEAGFSGGESLRRQIYKHLMNGVSHMIPFVVGGGVLIALSFLFGIYSATPGNEQYNPFAALLMNIGGKSMGFMVPVLSAFIAESIAKRAGLVTGFVGGAIALAGGTGFLGGIVSGFLGGYLIVLLSYLFRKFPESLRGVKMVFLFPVLGVFISGAIMILLSGPMNTVNEAMMRFLKSFQESNPVLLGLIVGCMSAFDMGGPVNKAAYVTGTLLLGTGNYYFMAGVSAACIAPPLITTYAVIAYKKYFDKNEYNAGLVNLILGCTHITEGAIPFAAKDPLRMLPTFMLGSSIAAILTYLFKVQVPAPHGGFLVLPVVTHPFLWLLSILAGTVVAGNIMGLLQKQRYHKARQEA